MTPLYRDPWYTFRFEDDRIIPRFHLDAIEAGRRVSVVKIDPQTGERVPPPSSVRAAGWTC
jgi:hypothetical protein